MVMESESACFLSKGLCEETAFMYQYESSIISKPNLLMNGERDKGKVGISHHVKERWTGLGEWEIEEWSNGELEKWRDARME